MAKRQQVIRNPADMSPASAREFMRRVAELIDEPIRGADISIGAEGASAANAIDFAVQLRDRAGNDIKEEWLVWAMVLNSTTGALVTSGQTATVTQGVLIRAIVSNALLLLRTNDQGRANVRVTITGVATRKLGVHVIGRYDASGVATWA